MSECLVSKFEQHRMFYLQSQWRLLALVTDLQFQDLAIVGVFSIIATPLHSLLVCVFVQYLTYNCGFVFVHIYTAIGERGKSHISHTRKLNI